jgi:hypothetical protein
VQDVLHADWHEVWHSPQPPVLTVAAKDLAFNVLMCLLKFFNPFPHLL